MLLELLHHQISATCPAASSGVKSAAKDARGDLLTLLTFYSNENDYCQGSSEPRRGRQRISPPAYKCGPHNIVLHGLKACFSTLIDHKHQTILPENILPRLVNKLSQICGILKHCADGTYI